MKREVGEISAFIITVFVLFHFFMLLLENRPSQSLTPIISPYYAWYTRTAGLVQRNYFFNEPGHDDRLFEIVATFPDGSTEQPFGPQTAWKNRLLYFMFESFLYSYGKPYADGLIQRIYEEYPADRKPQSISLRMYVSPIEHPGEWNRDSAAAFTLAAEHHKEWQ